MILFYELNVLKQKSYNYKNIDNIFSYFQLCAANCICAKKNYNCALYCDFLFIRDGKNEKN